MAEEPGTQTITSQSDQQKSVPVVTVESFYESHAEKLQMKLEGPPVGYHRFRDGFFSDCNGVRQHGGYFGRRGVNPRSKRYREKRVRAWAHRARLQSRSRRRHTDYDAGRTRAHGRRARIDAQSHGGARDWYY